MILKSYSICLILALNCFYSMCCGFGWMVVKLNASSRNVTSSNTTERRGWFSTDESHSKWSSAKQISTTIHQGVSNINVDQTC